MTYLERTEKVLGEENMALLKQAQVAVFGVGGVGGACAEALVRCGVGRIALFDPDEVKLSNCNRQLIALHSTVGMKKVEACRARYTDINPDIELKLFPTFYEKDNAAQYPLSGYSFVADCIDTVTSKLLLVENAKAAHVPLISALGTGNKLHPEMLEIADIAQTSVCPLARVMRRELKKRGIDHLPVVYSKEEPLHVVAQSEYGRHAPGSVSFVPPVAGYLMASYIVRTLLKIS